jgi:hypothetical protein
VKGRRAQGIKELLRPRALSRKCMPLDDEENYLIKKLFTAGLGMVCISNQARI